MKDKVVIFDLFETLITEWGHKKYTKNEMCADLGIERAEFDVFWDEKEQDRYIGKAGQVGRKTSRKEGSKANRSVLPMAYAEQ